MTPGNDLSALLQQTAWMRALARELVRDAHLADDLVQDTWLAALGRPPGPGPVRGWLATVLRRRSGELARERDRRARREELAASTEALPSAHDVVEKATLQRRLVEAVLELDEPHRTTLLLRFFEELPQREIARRMRVPVATVNSRLTRGLADLRQRLARGGGRADWLHVLVPLLREPALAPAAVLGASAMKLVAPVVVAASVLVGFVLWRGPSAAPRNAPAPSVALAAPEDVEGGAAEPSSEPAPDPLSPARTPSASADPAVSARPAPAPAAVNEHLLRGRVVDASGAGLAGVNLALAARDGAEPLADAARCTSGPGGWFELAHAGGAEAVVSTDPRWATVLAGSGTVRGETQAIVVVAERIDLAGIVVDEDGAPVPGASLELALPRGFGAEWGLLSDYSLPRQWSARSDADGRFALASVPAVHASTLATALGGFVTRVDPAPRLSDHALVVVLARPPTEAGLVRGVVLDPSGAPVEGARVSARAEVALTDRAGEFVLDVSNPATRPPLRALARGFQPAVLEPERDTSGRPEWPARVVLRLGDPTSTLRGRVVDADGHAVGGARVWLDDATSFGQVGRYLLSVEALVRGDERFWSWVESDERGDFVLEGLLARAYRVKAIAPDTLVTGELGAVAAADSPVELVLRTHDVHERVAGRVVSRSGHPVPNAAVRLLCSTYEVQLHEGRQNDAVERPPVFTGPDGEFELLTVPKSDVGLLVTGDTILFAGADLAREPDLEDVEIVAAVRLHLQVELDTPHDRADRVRVLDADGKPLVLSIMHGEGATFGPEQPLVDGRSAVLALDDSATTLVLLRGAEEVGRVPLSLAPGAPNVVRW